MNGTDDEDLEGGPVVTLSLWAVRVSQGTDDDGDPVLTASDGETSVEFRNGLGGDRAAVSRGARQLADALRSYADQLDNRRAAPGG